MYSSLYPLSKATRGVYPLKCDKDASVFFTENELTFIKLAIFLAKVLVFADVFFNVSCKYFTLNSVPWGQDTKKGVVILVSLVKGNQERLSREM